jgi:hypothetical protein
LDVPGNVFEKQARPFLYFQCAKCLDHMRVLAQLDPSRYLVMEELPVLQEQSSGQSLDNAGDDRSADMPAIVNDAHRTASHGVDLKLSGE